MGEAIVCLSHGYPQGYKPKRISEQLESLKKLFPHINVCSEIQSTEYDELPMGAEELFAIPPPSVIAPTYDEATHIVLGMLRLAYKNKFVNYFISHAAHKIHQQSEEKLRAWRRIVREQRHDVVIIPAQFGLYRCGIPPHRITDVLYTNEFGLGAYEVGIMLLTHPERFHGSEDLWIECVGDVGVPVFVFLAGEVRFSKGAAANNRYGAATGFLV